MIYEMCYVKGGGMCVVILLLYYLLELNTITFWNSKASWKKMTS